MSAPQDLSLPVCVYLTVFVGGDGGGGCMHYLSVKIPVWNMCIESTFKILDKGSALISFCRTIPFCDCDFAMNFIK